MEDYRLSNDYFNIPSALQIRLSVACTPQEAITTFLRTRDFLNAAKDEAERRYGDMNTYLRKGIGLSKNEIKGYGVFCSVIND